MGNITRGFNGSTAVARKCSSHRSLSWQIAPESEIETLMKMNHPYNPLLASIFATSTGSPLITVETR